MKEVPKDAITEKEKDAASVITAEADKPSLGTPLYYPPNWRDERHIRMQLFVLLIQRPNVSVKDTIEHAKTAADFVIGGESPSKLHKV